jgi:tetratricopeptide (TPR) repeat protein
MKRISTLKRPSDSRVTAFFSGPWGPALVAALLVSVPLTGVLMLAGKSITVFFVLFSIGFAVSGALFHFLHKGSDGFANFLSGAGREQSADDRDRDVWSDQVAGAETRGDYATAVNQRRELLASGLAANPGAEAFRIARLYEDKLERAADALYWYRKTLSLSDEDGPYRNEAEASIIRLADAVRVSDHDFAARSAVLEEAVKAEQWQEVEDLAAVMKRLYPRETLPHFTLAISASRRDMHDLAAARYEGVLALDPDHERATFNLALAWQKAGRYPEAVVGWEDYLARFGKSENDHTKNAERALEELLPQLKSIMATTAHAPTSGLEMSPPTEPIDD